MAIHLIGFDRGKAISAVLDAYKLNPTLTFEELVDDVVLVGMFDDELSKNEEFVRELLDLIETENRLKPIRRYFDVCDSKDELFEQIFPNPIKTKKKIVENYEDDFFNAKRERSNKQNGKEEKVSNNENSDEIKTNDDKVEVRPRSLVEDLLADKNDKKLMYELKIVGSIAEALLNGSNIVMVYNPNNADKEDIKTIKTLCEDTYGYTVNNCGCIYLNEDLF